MYDVKLVSYSKGLHKTKYHTFCKAVFFGHPKCISIFFPQIPIGKLMSIQGIILACAPVLVKGKYEFNKFDSFIDDYIHTNNFQYSSEHRGDFVENVDFWQV